MSSWPKVTAVRCGLAKPAPTGTEVPVGAADTLTTSALTPVTSSRYIPPVKLAPPEATYSANVAAGATIAALVVPVGAWAAKVNVHSHPEQRYCTPPPETLRKDRRHLHLGQTTSVLTEMGMLASYVLPRTDGSPPCWSLISWAALRVTRLAT